MPNRPAVEAVVLCEDLQLGVLLAISLQATSLIIM